jgi:hypothetical protein
MAVNADEKFLDKWMRRCHSNGGLLILSFLSFYGIIGDLILFGLVDSKSLDVLHIIISSFILCIFFIEVVLEQLFRKDFVLR